MDLGAFSVSLSVSDIRASADFYGNLGFAPVGGNLDENWLILRNGTTTIGIFQGMFEGNLLTFNPGWDADAEPLEEFTDVRALQRALKETAVPFIIEVDESTSGPGSFMIADPDGNVILVDQHR